MINARWLLRPASGHVSLPLVGSELASDDLTGGRHPGRRIEGDLDDPARGAHPQ